LRLAQTSEAEECAFGGRCEGSVAVCSGGGPVPAVVPTRRWSRPGGPDSLAVPTRWPS